MKLYELVDPKHSYIFEDYMTIDGRYLILNDNVFDLKKQKELGNIFSIENLKTIFENICVKDTPFIKEIRDILNNEKISLFEIKSGIIRHQKLLTEQEEAGISTDTDFQTTQKGTTHNKVFTAILAVARKIKKLLWSVGGIIVDTFLVASGIGKSVQWIPWAIVLALDVYQWASGDYGTDVEFQNASPVWKGLMIGFDVLGLTTAGAASKISRKIFEPISKLTSEKQIAQWVAKTPKAKAILQKMYNGISGVTAKLKYASQYLQKMPKLAQWFVKAVTLIPKFLGWLVKLLGKLLSEPGKIAQKLGTKLQGARFPAMNIGKGLKGATNVGGLMYGTDKTIQGWTQLKTGMNSVQLKNLKMMSDIRNEMNRIPIPVFNK
jgi:hypothetical protein